jgi:DNA/RNA-binding domain of Phe-tRNA-synthetase-like protein
VSLNGKEDIQVQAQHVIYADENAETPVVCWMWNHKDSRRTMLSAESTKMLFIFDCITSDDRKCLDKVLELLACELNLFGGQVILTDILDVKKPNSFLPL